ncbi:hypothetical protein EVAR_17919_1 [Eumeta japonica]|uniref:Uncharacterized protein n=1 Tax=Eumeta variegata TaxID=151549 RepID=A0A4C1UYV4_EUMVA|nr:hypothetical protein EVAR_17919_1 [Eumeta japonica]
MPSPIFNLNLWQSATSIFLPADTLRRRPSSSTPHTRVANLCEYRPTSHSIACIYPGSAFDSDSDPNPDSGSGLDIHNSLAVLPTSRSRFCSRFRSQSDVEFEPLLNVDVTNNQSAGPLWSFDSWYASHIARQLQVQQGQSHGLQNPLGVRQEEDPEVQRHYHYL